MNDGNALLRAIIGHANDDTPRLVYADWLEENGRAEEAEFIRLECRLESLTPDDPDFSDLLDRREELRLWLTAHVPGPELRLSAGLRVEDGADWWNKTRRGFPRFIEFEGLNRTGAKPIRALVEALESAFAKTPTRWLTVRSVTAAQLAELFRHPVIAELDHLSVQLDVATDERHDEACRQIAGCSYLRNLHGLALSFQVGEAGAVALAGSVHLGDLRSLTMEQSLWLTPAAIRAMGSAAWFNNLHSLELGELPAAAFEELCRLDPLPKLHTLGLQEAAYSATAWRAFSRSRAFPQLTRLINGTEMADGQVEALADAANLRLAVLGLSGCAIGNPGAEALARAPWLGSLRRLGLSFNGLTASGFAAIAGCRALAGLKFLDLSYNTPGPRGLRALAANKSLRGLSSLLLNGSNDRVPGLTPVLFRKFLTKLDMPNLRRLDLSRRPVGSRAARVLASAKFCNLTRLALVQCKLTDGTMAALASAPALQNLIEFDAALNGLNTGVAALADRRVMPRLAAANFSANRIDRDLARRLKRRPGIFA